ncbi:MAG: HD domain-containing protein [Bradyrhizobium sp.]|nr:HD domain-containing protein [Bradyrhizobium sp.]
MTVHLIADKASKISELRAMIEQRHMVTSEVLAGAAIKRNGIEAAVVSVDIAAVDNISALKAISAKLARIPTRIFIIDNRGRLSIVQAYALGATHVFTNPVNPNRLLAKLAPVEVSLVPSDNPSQGNPGSVEAASAGAASIAAMFAAAMNGTAVDIADARAAGGKIAGSIAENGLSDWLSTVRRHHEGTYQHCLLVTGVAVDFGLSLGLRNIDMERLYSAAMFHDIGKAKIPLAILDKPGKLDDHERALIQSHPVSGFEILRGNPAISPEILDGVRHHHELLDGSGYPDGLCAESITDIVRILTISDIFAALIEHRTYKPTMPREKAYEILQGMNGKLERPLVDAFREVALNR